MNAGLFRTGSAVFRRLYLVIIAEAITVTKLTPIPATLLNILPRRFSYLSLHQCVLRLPAHLERTLSSSTSVHRLERRVSPPPGSRRQVGIAGQISIFVIGFVGGTVRDSGPFRRAEIPACVDSDGGRWSGIEPWCRADGGDGGGGGGCGGPLVSRQEIQGTDRPDIPEQGRCAWVLPLSLVLFVWPDALRAFTVPVFVCAPMERTKRLYERVVTASQRAYLLFLSRPTYNN